MKTYQHLRIEADKLDELEFVHRLWEIGEVECNEIKKAIFNKIKFIIEQDLNEEQELPSFLREQNI